MFAFYSLSDTVVTVVEAPAATVESEENGADHLIVNLVGRDKSLSDRVNFGAVRELSESLAQNGPTWRT